MKHAYFFLKTICLIILLAGLCSCGSEYRVEVQLISTDNSELTTKTKEETATKLRERLAEEAKYREVTISLTASGLAANLITSDTTATGMDELSCFFGSVELEIYEAGDVTDPELASWFNNISAPYGAELSDANDWIRQSNLVLTAVDYVDRILLKDSLSQKLPDNYVLAWQNPDSQMMIMNQSPVYFLYLYRRSSGAGGAALTNKDVASSEISVDPYVGDLGIDVTLSKEGAEKFTHITTTAFEEGEKSIGFLINGEVWSNPRVMGPIGGGHTWISGGSDEEMKAIARQLTWEPLPVTLAISDQRVLPLDK